MINSGSALSLGDRRTLPDGSGRTLEYRWPPGRPQGNHRRQRSQYGYHRRPTPDSNRNCPSICPSKARVITG